MTLKKVILQNQAAMILLIGLFGCLPTSQAQDFTLFEEVEQSDDSSSSNQSRALRRSRTGVTAPEFTLLGTARIGDDYSAMLRHRDGSAVSVKLDPDSNTRIPGYSDYTVVQMESGSVSIRYPDSQPCAENEQEGIRCSSAGNIAILELVNAEPVVRRQPPRQDNSDNEAEALQDGSDADGDEANPRNPFEAIRAAARRGDNDDQPAQPPRFQPRRIAPEDVPEGMRVVSTPFGDRLVQE